MLIGVVWLGLVVVIAAIVIGVSLAVGEFNPRLLENGFASWIILAPLAVVAVPLLALGGADLSVGGVIAWMGIAFGMLAPELGLMPAILLALTGAVLVGVVTGAISGLTRINPALITLGSLALLRGIALIWSDGQSLRADGIEALASPLWTWGGLLLALIGSVVLVVVLMRTPFGGGQDSTRSGGMGRVLWLAVLYGFSGLIAGLVGIAVTGRLQVGMANNGTGYETSVLLVGLLSGVAVGRGANGQTLVALAAALVAAAALTFANQAMQIAGLPFASMEIVQGVLILVVAVISFALHWIAGRLDKRATAAAN